MTDREKRNKIAPALRKIERFNMPRESFIAKIMIFLHGLLFELLFEQWMCFSLVDDSIVLADRREETGSSRCPEQLLPLFNGVPRRGCPPV